MTSALPSVVGLCKSIVVFDDIYKYLLLVRETLSAPHSALRGVITTGVEPEQPVSRSKIRMYSVGLTNRYVNV